MVVLLRVSTYRDCKTWGGRLNDDAFGADMLDTVYISNLAQRRRTALGLPPIEALPPPMNPVPGSANPFMSKWLAGSTAREISLRAAGVGVGPGFVLGGPSSGSWMPALPPIDLNVCFTAEIEPNLVKLIGKGGYGNVYEANWRGQKVCEFYLTVSLICLHMHVALVCFSADMVFTEHDYHIVKLWPVVGTVLTTG